MRTHKTASAFLQVAFVACAMFMVSCGNDAGFPVPKETDQDKIKAEMLKVNKTMVEKEERQINDYISRHEWTMTKTATGLRYMIYAPAKKPGAMPKNEQIVRIKYSVKLVNGAEVYNSDKDGLKEFALGKAEAENGLEEGLKLMHQGDKAILVIPSHLAYGLAGDDNNIPRRAALIYDVELLNVR